MKREENAVIGMPTGQPDWVYMPSSFPMKNKVRHILIMPSLSSTGSWQKWWIQTAHGQKIFATMAQYCIAIFSSSSY